MRQPYRALWALGLLAALGVLAYFVIPTPSLEGLRDYISRSGPFAPAVFIVLKASTDVLAPLSGAPYYVLAQPLFGLWLGTLYTFVGDVLGYFVCFALARRYGQRLVERFAGHQALEKVERLNQRVGGWKGLLYARVIVPGMQDLISYAAGLTALPFSHYASVTLIVVLPQSLLLVAAGGAVFEAFPSVVGVYLLIAVALPIILWAMGARRQEHRNGGSDDTA